MSIVRVSAEGGPPDVVLGGRRHIAGFSLEPSSERIAFVASDHESASEIWLWEGGQEARLSSHNDSWLAEVQLGTPEELDLPGGDGTRQHGWMLHPPGFDPGRRYPLIVEIHGGPHAMYGHSFFHEMQVLAASGYVVYWANPRGSIGYGAAHLTPLIGHWGEPDTDDLMTALDQGGAEIPDVDTGSTDDVRARDDVQDFH